MGMRKKNQKFQFNIPSILNPLTKTMKMTNYSRWKMRKTNLTRHHHYVKILNQLRFSFTHETSTVTFSQLYSATIKSLTAKRISLISFPSSQYHQILCQKENKACFEYTTFQTTNDCFYHYIFIYYMFFTNQAYSDHFSSFFEAFFQIFMHLRMFKYTLGFRYLSISYFPS